MSATCLISRSLRTRSALSASRSAIYVHSYSTKTSESSEPKKGKPEDAPQSSCPAGTVLTGINYLKGQPPVLAKPDEEYPPWLWNLLKPKVYSDMSPGSKGEKVMLRKANRQRIKEQNFLKTQ